MNWCLPSSVGASDVQRSSKSGLIRARFSGGEFLANSSNGLVANSLTA